MTQRAPKSDCGFCDGSGFRVGHSEGCDDPFCTPGIYCDGRMVPCLCDPELMFRRAEPLPPEGRCWYCGDPFDLPGTVKERTKDHMVPTSRGGLDEDSNIVWACRLCNSRKCARTVEGFREYLQRICGEKIVFWGERQGAA